MAAYAALQPRMAAAGATCVYLSKPPGWFAKAAKAATATPVVLNCKGMKPDDTPVLLSLAELERLQRAARLVEELQVLTPDRFDLTSTGG